VPDAAGGFRFHYDPAIGMRFAIPIWYDIVLWQLWDKVECPALILRGEESDLLHANTVDLMLRRGPAAKAGMVSAVEIAGCGHAPALMDPVQINIIRKFLFSEQPDPRGRAPAGTSVRTAQKPEASTP
jgi:pimeloyl-ACP methyl ester carboxylesterase